MCAFYHTSTKEISTLTVELLCHEIATEHNQPLHFLRFPEANSHNLLDSFDATNVIQKFPFSVVSPKQLSVISMLNNAKNNSFIHSIFESLEERVLFDGVPDATFILPQPVAEPIPEQVQSLEQADLDAPRELILIDAGVENAEQLLTEILSPDPTARLRFA